MLMSRKLLALLMVALLGVALAGRAVAEETHSAAHGEAGHAEEAKPSIIPTPQQGIAPAITTLIVFALLVAVLAKYAWGPIASGLKAREDKIRQDITDAEAARARAEATLKEYGTKLAAAEQQVRDMLAKATTQGEQIATNIQMRAQQDAEETRQRALRDIETSRKQAIDEIYNEAASLATEVAKRVLPRSLSAEDQQALLNRSVEQVQTLRNTSSAA